MDTEENVALGGKDWQKAWKTADAVAKSEVSSCVQRGIPVPRREYAALAAGLAAREHYQIRFLGVALAIAALLFVVADVVVAGPRAFLELLIDGWVVILIGAAWTWRFWRIARNRSAARDYHVAMLNDPGEGIQSEPPRRSLREIRHEQLVVGLVAVVVVAGWVAIYWQLNSPGLLFSFGLGTAYFAVVSILIMGLAVAIARTRRRSGPQ